MSTPNPLVPQGSLLEQQAKSKSTFQVAAFIVALHVVILGGLLFLGCKKEEKLNDTTSVDSLIPPPAVTGDSNALPVDPFALPTNAVVMNPESSGGLVSPGVEPTVQPAVPLVPSAPVPSVETAPLYSGGTTEHVVQKGDVAVKIAKKHGVTLKQLQEANPGTDLAKLKLNQKLQIPASMGAAAQSSAAPEAAAGIAPAASPSQASHTVKGGDNLSRIAKKYGVSVKEIRAANGLKSNDIKVGQKLKIPASTGGSKSEIKASAPDASSPTVTPGDPLKP